MIWISRITAAATTAGLIALAGLFGAAPVSASCAGPSPLTSAHRFTGAVTKVENANRTATVLTDEGGTVTVNGGLAGASENTATSADRTYQVGIRYEFHPLNDASPYRDNTCTATRAIGATTTKIRTTNDASPIATRGSTDSGRGFPLWTGAGTVVLIAALGIWLIQRRRLSVAARPATAVRDESQD